MSLALFKTSEPFGVSFAYFLAIRFPAIPVCSFLLGTLLGISQKEMGEIDTKPIEPVQVALSLFGEKSDQSRHRSSSSDSNVEKGKDIEGLEKELANYRLQIEAKDTAYMEALLELEHYKRKTEDYSVLLKISDLERDRYIDECNEVEHHRDELESKMKGMVDQLSETAKIRAQLSHVLNEQKVTQADLLNMETELAAAKDLELKAITQAEMMETSANMEKERSEELLGRISEIHDAFSISKLATTEAEKEKCRIVSEKDAEMESLKATAFQAQEEIENLMETVEELENQLLTKTAYIDSLQAKLEQVTNVLGSMEDATSDGGIDLDQIKRDLEFKERKISDQAFYIEALETELKRLKLELENAKQGAQNLNCNVEALKSDLEKLEIEMGEVRERENDAQVEIAMLKAELHKGRSKIAAAEAAEARAQSAKSGLYIAVQQLAVEVEKAKKENQKLKQEVEPEEYDNFTFNHQDEIQKSPQGELVTFIDDERDKCADHITISIEEYNSLIRKAEKADEISKSLAEDSKPLTPESANKNEVEDLKKELEVAMAKIGLFRNRAEQAATRAEAAEKAKGKAEKQLRMWQEQKQRRNAALAALREESLPKQFSPPTIEKLPTQHQPLGKVLNMKF